MASPFEFATATRILFGPGVAQRTAEIVSTFGRRVLVVTGRDQRRGEKLLDSLRQNLLSPVTFSVFGEPELATIHQGLKLARRQGTEVVIGFGGGSAIDAGKAIAAMLANEGELLDYLEVIGGGKTLSKPSIPFVAIPTTAGTGSEVTRNAVLSSSRHRLKVSLRSPFMLPKVALVDPTLTHDLPAALTASTGLDALTQLIEPFVCSRATPITDSFCIEGIPRVARSLRVAFQDATNAAARADMSLASLLGGLALANAGLGAVHGFAGPIGGLFPAPHGAICATLLPHAMKANIDAIRQREPENPALARYEQVGRLLTGRAGASATDGIGWTRELVSDLRIPSLHHYGLAKEHIPDLVAKALQASSMKANPIRLTDQELAALLEQAL